MTITLELSPEVEARLRKRASLVGMPLTTLMEEITRNAAFAEVQQSVSLPSASARSEASPEEWLQHFSLIAKSASSAPVLSSDATRRTAIYED